MARKEKKAAEAEAEEKVSVEAEETSEAEKVSVEAEETSEAQEACEAAETSEQPAQMTDVEAKLCEQLKQKDEKLLRIAAEYDNYRKRTAKEKEDTYQNATINVLSEFLEVADNFERAKNAESEIEDYKKGIEMIFSQFLDKMKKLGAEPYGEAGETFDPELHMAVSHIEDESKGEGEITEVYQRGYKLGDKVIRHAVVIVAN